MVSIPTHQEKQTASSQLCFSGQAKLSHRNIDLECLISFNVLRFLSKAGCWEEQELKILFIRWLAGKSPMLNFRGWERHKPVESEIDTQIHKYIHSHMHIYMDRCVCVYTQIHTQIHIQIHTCMYMHGQIHRYTHTQIHTYIHIEIDTCLHTYLYRYIHRQIKNNEIKWITRKGKIFSFLKGKIKIKLSLLPNTFTLTICLIVLLL